LFHFSTLEWIIQSTFLPVRSGPRVVDVWLLKRHPLHFTSEPSRITLDAWGNK
jgi:hypothetical protein